MDIRIPLRYQFGEFPASQLPQDGEAADFAVKIGTAADMEEIRGRYGDDTGAVNNSGEYPSARRIACDDAFRILVLCTENCADRWREAVSSMTKQLTDDLVPRLCKTPDFRVIDAEYD